MSRAYAIGLTAAALAVGVSLAAADVQPEIRFARGATSATVEGAVIRGDRDIHPITAKAGQLMRVRITAIEDNAVFQIYLPGAQYRRDQHGFEFTGSMLEGAGETDDATQWSGTLPATGTYLIVVGGTRGNAGYRMTVSIR